MRLHEHPVAVIDPMAETEGRGPPVRGGTKRANDNLGQAECFNDGTLLLGLEQNAQEQSKSRNCRYLADAKTL